MQIPKGGRGKRAPYETQLVRIPVPLKGLVEAIANVYKTLVVSDSEDKSEALMEAIDEVATRFYTSDAKPVNRFSEGSMLVDRYGRICRIVDRYEWSAKDTRDWTQAKKLLKELRAEIEPITQPED